MTAAIDLDSLFSLSSSAQTLLIQHQLIRTDTAFQPQLIRTDTACSASAHPHRHSLPDMTADGGESLSP